ncbi:MAG: tyrosine-type recombinase/integrase [Gallionellaceae bacterium]
MGFYENAHRLRDGAIFLYTRPGRKKTTYQARLKIPGVVGYVIRSLKTADLSTAITEAEDLFYELRAEQKQGLDVKLAGNLRFKDLWKRFYDIHQAGLSIYRQRLHTSFAKNYFIPFLGEHRVADMPDAFVEKYWDWRINFYNPTRREAEGRTDPIPANAARTPSQKTLDMEAGMLRQIFRWGKRVGCVKREPWIKAAKVSHAKGVVRRPTFSETEWKRVYEYLRDWVKESMVTSPGKNGGKLNRGGPNALHRFQREMLRHYLLFLANSGLRPNEARQLLWRDIREEEDEDGTPALVIEVAPTTKTGSRTVVCREGTGHYLERLKKISKHTEPDDHIFCGFDGEPVNNFNHSFKRVLTDTGLLKDRWGKCRSIYSLRHFYCTQSLLSGVPIHVLAKNMGTSITHIEQHYSHVLTVMQAKQLQTKKFRPAKKETKTVPETSQKTRQL